MSVYKSVSTDGRYRRLDRRRRAPDRRAADGIGAGAALDCRYAVCRVRVCRARQCLGDARPAFWMALTAVVALAVAGY